MTFRAAALNWVGASHALSSGSASLSVRASSAVEARPMFDAVSLHALDERTHAHLFESDDLMR